MNRCRVLVCLALCAVWHVGPSHGQSQIDINVLDRLENLEKQVSRQQKQIADLQTRVTDQESVNAKQQVTINEQQATIVEQQKTILEQLNEISKQKPSLFEQSRRLTRLELKMDMPGAKADQQGKVTNGTIYAHSATVVADKDHDKLQNRLNKRLVVESSIAFHAVNPGAEIAHVGVGQNIMFPKVMLNLGAGYHNQHGVFIAPAPGIYLFSTSIMSFVNTHAEIQGSLVKNGAVLARVFAHGDSGREDQGSVTVVTQLATGDEVWVSEWSPADASYFGGYFTSFTGCLQWPM